MFISAGRDASRRRRRGLVDSPAQSALASAAALEQEQDRWSAVQDASSTGRSTATHYRQPQSEASSNKMAMGEKDLGADAMIVTRTKKIPWICISVILLIVTSISLLLAALGYYYKAQTDNEEAKGAEIYLKKLVRQVNDAPGLHWKAKYNPFGARVKSYNFPYDKNATAIRQSISDLNKFFESEKMQHHLRQIADFPAESLPKEFDAREHWSYCPSIQNVPNQGGCGACYAVAAAGVASDRACIASNGSIRALLSEEDILGCCAVCGNCYGGDPLKALVFWVNEGLVTGGRDGCRPYSADIECGVPCSPAEYPINEYRRTCHRRCQNIYFQNKYDDDKSYGTLAYSMFPRTMSLDSKGKQRLQVPTVVGYFNDTSEEPLSSEQIRHIIMKELFLSGPTTMAFPVTEEFLHYASGVFSPYPEENFSDRIVYWHVVRLIGWGQYADGKHYWLAINSFGRHWGDNGVFRIDTSMLEKFGLEYETGLP